MPLINVAAADSGSENNIGVVDLGARDEERLIRVLVKMAGAERRALVDPASADELIHLARRVSAVSFV